MKDNNDEGQPLNHVWVKPDFHCMNSCGCHPPFQIIITVKLEAKSNVFVCLP